ncbi:MAG: hypothetical protein GX892_07610, partial [Thermoanaerobacteraceae bacterium]|nr:hypothetical protein [Thermoanaerobacteraceae bacterium]
MGIKYFELKLMEKKLKRDEIFIAFLSALSSLDKQDALQALKKIVYGAESIERAFQGD